MTSSTTHARIVHLATLTRGLASSLRLTPPASLADELRQRIDVCMHLDTVVAELDEIESELRLDHEVSAAVRSTQCQGLKRDLCAVCVGLAIVAALVAMLRMGWL